MIKVEREATFAAAPGDVYDVVMNPARLADWVTIHQGLEGAPDGQLESGSRLTQRLKLAGREFKVHWTIVENDPCERVVWEGDGPLGSKAKVVYEFKRDGDSTLFSYLNEYDLPGGPLGNLAGPAVKRVTGKELDGSLERLRAIVE